MKISTQDNPAFKFNLSNYYIMFHHNALLQTINIKAYLAEAALCSWKSKVYACPVGATALANDVVNEPLPVPDSRTKQPETTSKYIITKLISAM
ncbi:hypothetical protein J1N35_042501 [Gossypium stocksii]|uniref:Uncharacterized protein n=1 Tax=Gossypium stocksii TaxID=47602 RepID=A0A9D3U5N0_9ROSI|nr:hypothetical protein J1N35_042501 [Gossypium stocksii]